MWRVKKLNDNSAICAYNIDTDKTYFIDRESLKPLLATPNQTIDDVFDSLCDSTLDNPDSLKKSGLLALLEKQ